MVQGGGGIVSWLFFLLLLFLTNDIEGIWADFILSTAYEAIKARGYEYVEWS